MGARAYLRSLPALVVGAALRVRVLRVKPRHCVLLEHVYSVRLCPWNRLGGLSYVNHQGGERPGEAAALYSTLLGPYFWAQHRMQRAASEMRGAGSPVLLTGSPINFAECLIGPKITWHLGTASQPENLAAKDEHVTLRGSIPTNHGLHQLELLPPLPRRQCTGLQQRRRRVLYAR